MYVQALQQLPENVQSTSIAPEFYSIVPDGIYNVNTPRTNTTKPPNRNRLMYEENLYRMFVGGRMMIHKDVPNIRRGGRMVTREHVPHIRRWAKDDSGTCAEYSLGGRMTTRERVPSIRR